MYAIFEAKGKQWRAEKGATIKLPSLDAEPGDRVVFDRVLLAERDDEILVGRPILDSAAVAVEVTEHGRGEKIVVFKRKRRKNYRRKYGHRQDYTEVRVVEIDLENATAPLPTEVGEEQAPPAAGEPAVEEAKAETAEPEAEEAEEVEAEAEEVEEEEAVPEEIDITGAAEDLAEEHGVDVTAIDGTGKDGRILKSDVETAIEEAEEEAEGEAGEEAEAAADEAVIPDDVDITNAARELAEEHGIDVTAIEGTGKDGRVLKSDVEQAIEEKEEE